MTENDERLSEGELTEQEVWDVLKFADSITSGQIMGQVLTPILMNQRMQDITLNPIEATVERVETALKTPKSNEEFLAGFSEHFELTSMPYKRMLHYLAKMLSFDLVVIPTNAQKEDYSKKTFKNDQNIVYDFLDKFNHRKEFKLIMTQLLRQEVFFGIFRDDGQRYTIQELPNRYCKIDGRWDYGLLYSFDFNWFRNSGIDINMYPPIFKEMYSNYFDGNSEYIPSLNIVGRKENQFANWVDTSPVDGFWAWKLSPELITRIPYLSALFPDLALQPLIRNLQKDSNIISATKILFGQVPLMQRDVKGSVMKDQVAVSPELLGKFLGLISKGLYKNIKVASAPLEDVQAISFPSDERNMYDDYLKTTTASSGINSRLIFSTEKPNAIESQLSIDVDEYLVEYAYPMFEDFLEYQVNKLTKRYKFKFILEGTEFSTNKDRRFERQMRLSDKGIILPQKISASLGMNYHDMIRLMEMGEADGFIDKLTPLVNVGGIAGVSEGETGRPRKPASELTDSGSQTREDGGNISKGGNI